MSESAGLASRSTAAGGAAVSAAVAGSATGSATGTATGSTGAGSEATGATAAGSTGALPAGARGTSTSAVCMALTSRTERGELVNIEAICAICGVWLRGTGSLQHKPGRTM